MKRRSSSWPDLAAIRRRATHVAPSGMGGAFDVELVQHYCGRTVCRVISPTTEWHDWMITPLTDQLRAKGTPA